jgi:hypothetical protein
MHVLLHIKSFDSYIDMVFLSKKQSDWDSLLMALSENKELEYKLLEKTKSESDLNLISSIITRLWTSFKKYEVSSSQNIITTHIFIKILSNLLKSVIEENQFIKSNSLRRSFYNLSIMIELKIDNSRENIDKIIAGYLQHSDRDYLIKLINMEKKLNFNLSENYNEKIPLSIEIDKVNIPTDWNHSDMPKSITFSYSEPKATYTTDDNMFYTLKSNLPIKNTMGIYYFEIVILNIGDDV